MFRSYAGPFVKMAIYGSNIAQPANILIVYGRAAWKSKRFDRSLLENFLFDQLGIQ